MSMRLALLTGGDEYCRAVLGVGLNRPDTLSYLCKTTVFAGTKFKL